MPPLADSAIAARHFAAALEPTIGQVYFAPEAHAAYQALGFGPSPGGHDGLQMPDGVAYFTSRGALMGQVAPTVVAAAFAVFNPAAVVPSIAYGWTLTDAATIRNARRAAAVAQLRRVLGSDALPSIARAAAILERSLDAMRPEGRALFAGALDHYEPDVDEWHRFFQLGDIVREYRGDSHTASWIAAGIDATEINLVSERYMGLPVRTYARTRAWSDEQFDAAADRLRHRGWFDTDDDLTDSGRAARESVEVATDSQMQPVVTAFADDLDELVALLRPMGAAVRAAHGYPGGAADLWPNR